MSEFILYIGFWAALNFQNLVTVDSWLTYICALHTAKCLECLPFFPEGIEGAHNNHGNAEDGDFCVQIMEIMGRRGCGGRLTWNSLYMVGVLIFSGITHLRYTKYQWQPFHKTLKVCFYKNKITWYNTIQCVVPENIHTPTTEGIGHSRGVGGSKAQEIPEGRGG